MSPTMKDLGIDRLTPDQRLLLAHEIWESLENDPPKEPISPELYAELIRRDAELEANPGSALTWEQIRKSVESGQ